MNEAYEKIKNRLLEYKKKNYTKAWFINACIVFDFGGDGQNRNFGMLDIARVWELYFCKSVQLVCSRKQEMTNAKKCSFYIDLF